MIIIGFYKIRNICVINNNINNTYRNERDTKRERNIIVQYY